MKRIIAVLLAVVLVAGGLGSFAYAQVNSSHEPMTGQKLVGTSQFGSAPHYGGLVTYEAVFTFTNPDCVGEITVDRISIIREDGTVIYEGQFLRQRVEDGEVVDSTPVTIMKPHGIWFVNLAQYMPNGKGGWLNGEQARSLALVWYTVEIFWTGSKQGCPLTGDVLSKRVWNGDQGNVALASSPMVNLEQKLMPGPPPTPLKIGALAPITGPAAGKGTPMYHGEQDYFRYINDEMGGIQGYPIAATFYDTQYNSDLARQYYKEAVGSGALLITAMSSKETVACRCLFDEDEMPFIHAYSSPPCLHPPGHAYATLPAQGGDDCAAFMNWLHDSGQTPCNLALYGLNNATGWSARDAARALAETLGISVVGYWEHTAGVTPEAATATLQQIQVQNPDWLYVSSTPAPSATIAKAAHDLGMTTGICLGQAGAFKSFIDLAGEAAEGVYGMQGMVLWGADVPGMAKAMEYCHKFHPEDEGNLDYLAGWHLGMCAAQALSEALDRVKFKELTPQKVEEKGVQNVSFDAGGLTSWVDWTDDYDRRGAKSANLCVVGNGEWVLVEPWLEAPLIRYEDYDWFEPIVCP
jgi:branched-chain amino acid transport system substrate-binding protein